MKKFLTLILLITPMAAHAVCKIATNIGSYYRDELMTQGYEIVPPGQFADLGIRSVKTGEEEPTVIGQDPFGNPVYRYGNDLNVAIYKFEFFREGTKVAESPAYPVYEQALRKSSLLDTLKVQKCGR